MKRINLLPPEARTKASRERGLAYVLVALVAVVVVLGLLYFQQMNQVNDKQAELDQLNSEVQAVEAQRQALEPYATLQTTRQEMDDTARAINQSRVRWSTIFEEVSLVIPDNVRLTTLTCAVPETMLPGETSTQTSSTTGTSSSADVTFVGSTYNSDDIAEFMTRLGLVPQLKDIQLVTSTRTEATSSSSTSGTSTGTSSTAATVPYWTFTVTASLRHYMTSPPTTVLSTEVGQ